MSNTIEEQAARKTLGKLAGGILVVFLGLSVLGSVVVGQQGGKIAASTTRSSPDFEESDFSLDSVDKGIRWADQKYAAGRMIDEITRADSITFSRESRTIRYHFTVLEMPAFYDAASFKSEMKGIASSKSCSMLKPIIQHDYRVVFAYQLPDGYADVSFDLPCS